MKKALISPNESKANGYRIAQVEPAENIFPVADPMYWIDCADDVVADQWYFDPTENTIKQIPVHQTQPVGGAPSVIA
jgi:hypothetical protein